MHSPRFLSLSFRLAAGALALALVVICTGTIAASAACTTDTALVTVAPVTGVVVRSNALVTGIGCGTGDAQIFQYVAVVTSQDGKYVWTGTYACFADAIFVNLPFALDGGPTTFDVKIFAYSKAASDAFDVASKASSVAVDDAGVTTGIDDLAAASTYTTDCHATQQPNVEVLADCDPLSPTAVP